MGTDVVEQPALPGDRGGLREGRHVRHDRRALDEASVEGPGDGIVHARAQPEVIGVDDQRILRSMTSVRRLEDGDLPRVAELLTVAFPGLWSAQGSASLLAGDARGKPVGGPTLPALVACSEDGAIIVGIASQQEALNRWPRHRSTSPVRRQLGGVSGSRGSMAGPLLLRELPPRAAGRDDHGHFERHGAPDGRRCAARPIRSARSLGCSRSGRCAGSVAPRRPRSGGTTSARCCR